MVLNPVISGICVSCSKSSTCSFLRNSKTPVQFCEEFETLSANSPSSLSTSNYINYEHARALGVCFNCDHRDSCSNLSTTDIKYSCENYQ
ncbi:MAG: hypothetical protein JXR95_02325 [Deltaproteobacteria bacterium]|nr:hypothetical protein [Deltaproteobacteria bacterium]